jgi:hypothetical protein
MGSARLYDFFLRAQQQYKGGRGTVRGVLATGHAFRISKALSRVDRGTREGCVVFDDFLVLFVKRQFQRFMNFALHARQGRVEITWAKCAANRDACGVRRTNEWIDARPHYPVCCRRFLTHLLNHTINVFNNHSVDYRLAHGTALGALRDGTMIPWTTDVDVFVRPAQKARILNLVDPLGIFRIAHGDNNKRTHCGHTLHPEVRVLPQRLPRRVIAVDAFDLWAPELLASIDLIQTMRVPAKRSIWKWRDTGYLDLYFLEKYWIRKGWELPIFTPGFDMVTIDDVHYKTMKNVTDVLVARYKDWRAYPKTQGPHVAWNGLVY